MAHPAQQRIMDQYALHALTNDERVTAQSMLAQEQSSRLLLMPTHHINEMGDMMGFRFTCNAFAVGNSLPVVRTMFHGHTLVECQAADEALIMRLMSQPAQNRERMLEFMRGVEHDCVSASLDCVPENASSHTQHGTLEATGLLTVDSQHWTPELPDRIGIYHAYIRGFNRDVRTHRLFIVCSGGMARASDSFCNLVIDVGRHWTAQDVCDSQEAWWLRKGCQRARCQLIKRLADAFEIPVRSMQVYQSLFAFLLVLRSLSGTALYFPCLRQGRLSQLVASIGSFRRRRRQVSVVTVALSSASSAVAAGKRSFRWYVMKCISSLSSPGLEQQHIIL